MNRATPGKVRFKWVALALGLLFCAAYVARQESAPSRAIQSDISSPSTKKPQARAPVDNHPSKKHVVRDDTDREDADRSRGDGDLDEQDANDQDTAYLASATPALSDPLYHSDPLHDDEVVPHPITQERIRMAEQHALFEHITESLKLKDFRLARKLINQHETQYGSDEENDGGWEADRRGFSRILDCIETRSEHARALAEDFIEQERLSSLRRHVRRVCVDGRDF